MNTKEQTTASYRQHADRFVAKFDGMPPRTEDIERAFSFVEKKNPKVVEIGCGSGRDAVEITKRTDHYVGWDISPELIAFARQKLPMVPFQVSDLETTDLPVGTDLVLAFASLIHSPKEQLQDFFARAYQKMATDGVIYCDLKYRPSYRQETTDTEFGTRTYYYYNAAILKNLVGPLFEVVYEHITEHSQQQWCVIALKKVQPNQ